MSQFNALIAKRLKKSEPSAKMAELAEKSAAGGLTSFNGFFQVSELSSQEKAYLEEILKTHAKNPSQIDQDLNALIALTSEVKAINHQAALLHGERIKKVHQILTKYQEGAFSAWLVATYGNRQTPYNLMQYYDFYQAVPLPLRKKMEEMPRQVIYSLASRDGDFDKKIQIVIHYQGETKNELLIKIRDLFPLEEKDKRRENVFENLLKLLQKADILLKTRARLSTAQKDALKELLTSLSSTLNTKK